MKLIVLGAPGAGKGTQAKVISEKYNIPAISTGAIIREAIEEGTDFGKKAKVYIDKGDLLPDDMVIGLVVERVNADDCKNGFILDGFPRTIAQAHAMKENGINTAVDTCGFVSKKAFDKAIPYTDVFLYDIKAYDEDVHIKCTGHSNKIILENLKYLESKEAKTEIRIPYVPDYNDEEIEKIARFLKPFKNISKVRVLPYHNYAGSKYGALGIPNTQPERLPTEEEISHASSIIQRELM